MTVLLNFKVPSDHRVPLVPEEELAFQDKLVPPDLLALLDPLVFVDPKDSQVDLDFKELEAQQDLLEPLVFLGLLEYLVVLVFQVSYRIKHNDVCISFEISFLTHVFVSKLVILC